MPYYYHWAIELTLGSFSFLFFYVVVLFLLGLSDNQLTVLTQCFSDSQAVCSIFFLGIPTMAL